MGLHGLVTLTITTSKKPGKHDTMHLLNDVSLLRQRRRRWASLETTWVSMSCFQRIGGIPAILTLYDVNQRLSTSLERYIPQCSAPGNVYFHTILLTGLCGIIQRSKV